ncbi:MAG: class I adenylate-forming enzyme family protein, partial [Gammaproteobacteria bacterium]
LDALIDRVGAALQRDGLRPGDTIAISAATSIEYLAAYLGAVRVGVVVAPMSPASRPEALAAMLKDSAARIFFLDAPVAELLGDRLSSRGAPDLPGAIEPGKVALDGSAAGIAWQEWLAAEGATPAPVELHPDDPFNIIYSSGTTGTPKGIVQPYQMRWLHSRRGRDQGYSTQATGLISTPLYSNTTLVAIFPALTMGATLVLMPRFDAGRYLQLVERHRVTHAMLVPVQYQRLMAHPDFDRHDVSSLSNRFCTSAPFPAELKAEVLRRWPGKLVDSYGMTEGGGVCVLAAHEFPDKLHTVGRPAAGHDIRLIDEQGNEVAQGQTGEIVGFSPGTMIGYRNQPGLTGQAEWRSPDGRRFIRTGDLGRFDEDGFLTLVGRKKDMIISGGFNVYPGEIEQVIWSLPAVQDCAVIGVPDDKWGEAVKAVIEL